MQDEELSLAQRNGLPEPLRVLLSDYPRADWPENDHFHGLVRFWLDRHIMFRGILDKLGSAVAAQTANETDLQTFAPRLHRLGSTLVGELHMHHQIEDQQYFPRLEALEPALARGFGLLDQDHQALDGLLGDFTSCANQVLKGEGAEPLRDAVETLNSLLDRHLWDEEELIVPVILKHGPGRLS